MGKVRVLSFGLLLIVAAVGSPSQDALDRASSIRVVPNLAEDVTSESSNEQATQTPTPTPPSPECAVSQVDIKKNYTSSSYTQFSVDADAKGKQSCLMDVILSSFNTWEVSRKSQHFNINADAFKRTGHYGLTEYGVGHKWSDDAVLTNLWDLLLARSGTDRTKYQENKQYLDCAVWGNYATDSQGSRIGGGYWEKHLSNNDPRGQKACFTGSFFVNNDTCALVPVANVEEICGNFAVDFTASTPISVVLDPSDNSLNHATPVEFKLDPGSPAKIWEWRASDKAPLLVYDPEHTGNITSATQLFGNWTFGGKSSASLQGSAGSAWTNGFEALATLDKDRDGQVSGAELDGLALWFDGNKDAVSQSGEVRPLASAGISALFYADPQVHPESGDTTVRRGFLRSVNGTMSAGSLVDWIGVGTNSAFELATRNSLRSHAALPALSQEAAPAPVQAAPLESDLANESRAAGMWVWSIDEGSAAATGAQGVLLVFSDGSNGLTGQTMTELRLGGGASHGSSATGMIRFAAFEGEENISTDKRTALRFSSRGQGFSTRSEAIISENGQTMTGKTTAVESNGRSLTYTWKAARH